MKFVQKLGKALMLPVACLPICGILMGLGYAMCPSTMQGGDVTGIVQQIGFFLVKVIDEQPREYRKLRTILLEYFSEEEDAPMIKRLADSLVTVLRSVHSNRQCADFMKRMKGEVCEGEV